MRPIRILAAVLAIAAIAPRARAQAPGDKAAAADITEDARKHFKAGVAFLQDPDGARYEEAYAEFKAAYAASPSPKILGNLGLCAMKLERDGEAIDAYSRYLREVSDIDPDERAQIVQDLQTLQVSVARLTITVDQPNATILDRRIAVRGDKVTNVYPVSGNKLEIGVRPGHHEITARLDGFEDAAWEVDAYGGARESHAFTLKPRSAAVSAPPGAPGPASPEADSSGRSAAPLVIAGVGGAMVLAGTITGVMALRKESDIEKSCPNDACPASFDLAGERSSAKTLVGTTDVMLLGGAVLAVGGLAWWLLDAPAAKPSARGPWKNAAFACTGTACVGSMQVKFQ